MPQMQDPLPGAIRTNNQKAMESISVFDIFKVGVGPSSSHTMGPWRAAQRFLDAVASKATLARVRRVRIDLYGSLAKTGHGHGTDLAVILALSGEDPETCKVEGLTLRVEEIKQRGLLQLSGRHPIDFDFSRDLLFHMGTALPFHPNGITFTATLDDASVISETYYSVGGGFVVQEGEAPSGSHARKLPFPIEHASQLLGYCRAQDASIPQIVGRNELTWRTGAEIREGLLKIWREMQACIWRGCNTEGVLPGGLNVVRRAARMSRKLLKSDTARDLPHDLDEWTDAVTVSARDFEAILKWVSAFALAVNEENACFGRVVTAPTNGAAGVIPAVMMYARCFKSMSDDATIDFMLAAGEVGSLFKKGATISAAMGGCQAEIGVSSAMAAAGLTQVLGGSPGQVLMAAEIAMEHHLGMTCDPIGGLVQIPCIERNTMGAIKAITAANVALESDPAQAKVTLDQVIATMWQTAKDMHHKYKETAEGGLAVAVSISEC
ncbi:MAG: L-serine ammonia-lyase [Phycisphaeraceae bacterium]|nr:L-serine ammonia-lyase [Phycisphaeraceae bacterium]